MKKTGNPLGMTKPFERYLNTLKHCKFKNTERHTNTKANVNVLKIGLMLYATYNKGTMVSIERDTMVSQTYFQEDQTQQN